MDVSAATIAAAATTETGLRLLGAGLAAGLGVVGPGVGMGVLFGSAIERIARQPELRSEIRLNLFIGIGIIEALALYALVVALILLFVVK